MKLSELRSRVRSAAPPDAVVTDTDDGISVRRGGNTIQFAPDPTNEPDGFGFSVLAPGRSGNNYDAGSVEDAMRYL